MTRNPFQKAVNSLFEKMGEKGLYKTKEVLFLLSAPDETVGVGFLQAQTPMAILRIRISDAPDLQIHDTILTGTISYMIIAEPKKDLHHLYWKTEVTCN